MTPRREIPNSVSSAIASIALTAAKGTTSTVKVLPWIAGLALIAFAAGAHLGKPTELLAATGAMNFADADGDGFADAHEEVLGLLLDRVDSDRDGWSDVEEVTLGSNPKDHGDRPTKKPIGIEVSGYMDDGIMHVVTTIFLKGGLGGGHTFQLGVLHRGVPFLIPPSVYLPYSDVTVVTGRTLTDTIHILDVQLPAGLIASLGEVTFFAVGSPVGGDSAPEASALTMVSSAGVPFKVAAPGNLPKNPSPGVAVRGRGFYTPLTPIGNLPVGAAAGQVCVQFTRVVGSGGTGIQLEVTGASCQTGDGICPASCSGTVGSTYHVPDPLVLIGG